MTDNILTQVQAVLQKLKKEKPFLLIAIDGRCAAGKTTLAARLRQSMDCNVFHMDDFFLPPELRTRERLAYPGGNIDEERFRSEVLCPVLAESPFSYRPYSCRLQRRTDPVSVQPKPLSIAEGSYSCHPNLWDYYDLRIFLDISRAEQLRRIRERNGEEQLKIFEERWIPLEEQYFSAFQIQQRCDLSFLSE